MSEHTTTTTDEFVPSPTRVGPDHPPSSAYDGCLTTEACNARYKELFANHNHDNLGINKATQHELQEDLRRALALVAYRPARTRSSEKRTPVEPVRPVEHEDGRMSIVCAVCKEDLPIKRFPTISGKPGVREGTCRACKKARKATAPVREFGATS